MDMYGIAAMSMASSQIQLQQAVSISATKKAMDVQEVQAAALLEMMPPPSTHTLDAYC